MIRVLKCWPEPFELIRIGVKRCEVRSTVGLGFRYQGGDVLRLREFAPDARFKVRGERSYYSGRALDASVIDLLDPRDTPSEWNLRGAGGIVVMSLRVLREFEFPPSPTEDPEQW